MGVTSHEHPVVADQQQRRDSEEAFTADLKLFIVLLHRIIKSANGTFRVNPAEATEAAARQGRGAVGSWQRRVNQVVLPNALSILRKYRATRVFVFLLFHSILFI